MKIEDLKLILKIYEEKSITKTSAKMFIAQPALSQKLKKIENELNITIFLRTDKGVIITEEGKYLIEFIKKVLKEEKVFKEKLNDLFSLKKGTINLGFTGTQASFILPHFLKNFKEKYPNIKFILKEGSSDEIEKWIADGFLDVGIIHTPILNKDLFSFEISRDKMVIIPKSNSNFEKYVYYKFDEHNKKVPYMSLDFFIDEPIIMTLERQRSRMTIDEILKKAGIEPKIKQISKNLSTLHSLALLDYASIIFPEKQINSSLNKKYFYIDEKYSIPYSFCVAVFKENYLSKSTKLLLNYLKKLAYTF